MYAIESGAQPSRDRRVGAPFGAPAPLGGNVAPATMVGDIAAVSMPTCPDTRRAPDGPAGEPTDVSVVVPSRRPHREQYARWSAFWCEQCLHERMAVVSLFHPWYRFDHECRRQDELPGHRKDPRQEPGFQEGRRRALRREAGL